MTYFARGIIHHHQTGPFIGASSWEGLLVQTRGSHNEHLYPGLVSVSKDPARFATRTTYTDVQWGQAGDLPL